MRLRFLHVMIRVADLDRSLTFYVERLGMIVRRRVEAPDEGRRAAFVGYDEEIDGTVLELTQQLGADAMAGVGSFGHLAIETDNVVRLCSLLRSNGVVISAEPRQIPNGKTIAFTQDPDGNAVELVQQPAPADGRAG